MSRIRKLPYFTPDPERLLVGDWVQIKDGNPETLHELFPIWEPAVDVSAYVPVKVDLDGVLSDCNLDRNTHLRLGAVWHSPGTVLRGRGTTTDLDLTQSSQEISLGINVEGINLAKSIELSVLLILVSSTMAKKPFTPNIPGSILLRSTPHKVLLEGQGARFPVEVIDFSHSHYPDDAGWVLHWDSDDLEQTFLGDVRLYFNTNHQRVIQAVSENRPEDFDLREAIRFDVARTLIYSALNNEDFLENPQQYASGSVGGAIRDMIQLYFSDTPISQIKANSAQPQSFEPKLQAKLQAFWPID